jgi:hypothetical protein
MTTNVSPSEETLLTEWAKRCRRGQFSPGVIGTCQVRVYHDRTGDLPVIFPQVASRDVVPGLAPDERFALEYAERIVSAHRRAGRKVFAIVPAMGEGFPIGEELQQFDPTRQMSVLILSQLRARV